MSSQRSYLSQAIKGSNQIPSKLLGDWHLGDRRQLDLQFINHPQNTCNVLAAEA